jgi:hypothetical protein
MQNREKIIRPRLVVSNPQKHFSKRRPEAFGDLPVIRLVLHARRNFLDRIGLV